MESKSKRNYERTLYASEKNDIDIALAGEVRRARWRGPPRWGPLLATGSRGGGGRSLHEPRALDFLLDSEHLPPA